MAAKPEPDPMAEPGVSGGGRDGEGGDVEGHAVAEPDDVAEQVHGQRQGQEREAGLRRGHRHAHAARGGTGRGGQDQEHEDHRGALDQVRQGVGGAPRAGLSAAAGLEHAVAEPHRGRGEDDFPDRAGQGAQAGDEHPGHGDAHDHVGAVGVEFGRTMPAAGDDEAAGAVDGDGEARGGEDGGEPGGAAHVRPPSSARRALARRARRPGPARPAAGRIRGRWPCR